MSSPLFVLFCLTKIRLFHDFDMFSFQLLHSVCKLLWNLIRTYRTQQNLKRLKPKSKTVIWNKGSIRHKLSVHFEGWKNTGNRHTNSTIRETKTLKSIGVKESERREVGWESNQNTELKVGSFENVTDC